jgi:hypothetical protein
LKLSLLFFFLPVREIRNFTVHTVENNQRTTWLCMMTLFYTTKCLTKVEVGNIAY